MGRPEQGLALMLALRVRELVGFCCTPLCEIPKNRRQLVTDPLIGGATTSSAFRGVHLR